MKKLKSISAILIALSIILSTVVFAAPAKKLYADNIELALVKGGKVALFNGEDTVLETPPFESNGVLMLPADYILEQYGYTANEQEKGVFTKDDKKVVLSADSNTVSIDGEEKQVKSKTTVVKEDYFFSEDVLSLLGLTYKISGNGVLAVFNDDKTSLSDESMLLKLQGIYVATDGSASAFGYPYAPVNSLENAKKLAIKYMREYGTQYKVRIFVKSGTYRFDKGVDFTETEFTIDTYKGLSIESYDDNKPEFTGSVLLNAEEFIPVTDAQTLARVHKNGRGKVASLDLTKMGITSLEVLPNLFNYVYLNDIEQVNARWPNEGESTIYSVPQQNSFTFSETDPTRWTEAKNAYVFGHFSSWGWEWHQGIITSVNAATKTINIKGAVNDVMKTSAAGTTWYACNLLEEIDMPGEWYVDTETLKLYYYPPYRLKDQKLEMTKYLGTIMNFNEPKNVTIRGINFNKCGSPLVFNGSNIKNVTVDKCNFSNIQAKTAISFQNNSRTYDVSVTENTAYNLFGGFVYFKCGNVWTLEDGNGLIKNNHVALAAQYYKNSGAIGGPYQTENNGSMGQRAVNNIIQDICGGAGIGFGGTDCAINNNEIVNAGKYMHDYGGIYFGRSASYYNTEVGYNFLHHFDNDSTYVGLYNDDAYAGANWHHNVCVDMQNPCIQAPGLNTKYMYNLAVNCAKTGSVGSRKSYGDSVYYKGTMWKEVNSLIHNNEDLYKKAYPQMFDWLERDKEFFNVSWDSIYYGNVGVGNYAINDFVELEEYGAKEFEENGKTINIEGKNGQLAGNLYYEYSEDLFVDAENLNYNVNPESQLAKDVPQILEVDVTKSGLTEDAEYLLEKPENGSHLRYPSNGQKNLNANEITFSWDPVKGASFYEIIVATDPQLENVVYDEEIRENGTFNQITLKNFTNNCVYYWKVVSKSVVRQNQFEIDSLGGPYAFKTAVRDELNKENLRLAITSFEEFCNNDLQNPEYEFDEEFVQNANKKLEEFKTVFKKAKTQAEVDEAEEEVYYIVKKSPFYMKVHFENVKGIYDKNAKWDGTGNVTVDGDGVVTISSPGRSDNKVEIKNENSILCFKMKLADLGTGAGNYQGFDIKLNEEGQGYLIIFKHDIIEWQRINKTLTEIPNDFIKAGVWHDVQAGGINTPNGVLQFFRVDGRLIYAELDQTANQTRTEKYFRVRKNQLGDIQIKEMEEVPADGVLIDDILKNFSEPQSPQHLQTLFIGSSDAVEMGSSSLFAKLDKAKLAELLYPVVKEQKPKMSRNDVSEYKKKIEEMCVVAGYNQGIAEEVLSNKIVFLYDDILKVKDIDQNGVTIYSWYNKLSDKYKAVATESMMNGNCKNIEELRMHIAKQIFATVINSCHSCFAGQSEYITDVLTKENAKLLGIDISDYLALSLEKKLKANDKIGNSNSEGVDRSVDKLIEDIHTAVKEVK